MIKENMKASGRLAIVVKDSNGAVKQEREVDNLVVGAGLDWISGRMADTGGDHTIPTAMSHMAIGSGTTAADADDTDIESILGSREELDSTTVTDNTVQYISSFEAGDGTGAVTEAGIFNAATGGTMLCRTVFSEVNKDANDTMTITWTITISAS